MTVMVRARVITRIRPLLLAGAGLFKVSLRARMERGCYGYPGILEGHILDLGADSDQLIVLLKKRFCNLVDKVCIDSSFRLQNAPEHENRGLLRDTLVSVWFQRIAVEIGVDGEDFFEDGRIGRYDPDVLLKSELLQGRYRVGPCNESGIDAAVLYPFSDFIVAQPELFIHIFCNTMSRDEINADLGGAAACGPNPHPLTFKVSIRLYG